MSPAGGLGAIVSIHDAVTLANRLSTLRFAVEEDIDKMFKEAPAERYPIAKAGFESSQVFNRYLGKSMVVSLVRGLSR
ncbi:hypothetical protein MVEG_12442 [Podila verticillata NRRL 6337]|uniref:Uncharacterized protein n=1 Tax=Podila verticillata NRRL 6337 TaxID=1069443 RepID=A0A086TIE3_9FUNG|nr:hypothetical protein MVEG_12442 [Podila verticillata NRRL 6337]